ncbi:MAG: GTP 3',8-cyclase MoaA [Chloroflexota bacterium]|nr:GTP 3',8-cyclase MoaA [Chloroflexota bacterium]
MTLLVDPPRAASFIPAGPLAGQPHHAPTDRRLVDGYGRQIRDMRISITDRCNFRCVYCMPEEGMQWLKRESILSFDEIERIARVAVNLGVDELRLTGGEPTLRPDLPKLVRRLSGLPVRSLSLTTNGFLLRSMARPLAEAGLKRINVSLDTLQHDRFHQIARRHGLDEVLAGLEELERYPSIAPIKVNVVAMRDFTEAEVVAFAKLARRKPYVIRFIEFMPLDADGNWQRERVLTGTEIKDLIERDFMPLVRVPAEASSTSRRFTFADGIGELGFINPVSQPFCGTCNRIRLTADGQLRTCLFSIDEWDLRAPIRSGADDEDLAAILIEAVSHKELKHKINEGDAFQRASRSMSQIGG